MQRKNLKALLVGIFQLLLSCCYGQMMIPASLSQRTDNAKKIVIGKVVQKHSYWDANHHNIWTINLLEVNAYFKNDVGENADRIAIITSGGVVGNEGQITCPSYEFVVNHEYAVFLDADNRQVDDKNYRRLNPAIPQCEPYASSQGVLGYVDGKYYDLMTEAPMSEVDFTTRLATAFNLRPNTPDNRPFVAREAPAARILLGSISTWTNGAGTSNSLGDYIGATILPANELIISGSGFGAAAGSVEFDHVDDGIGIGSSGYAATIGSDIISWSDTQIRIRIPGKAGTGIFRIKDNAAIVVATSPSNINIIWSQINITTTTANFPVATRQQVKFINQDGVSGGYIFQYSTVTASGNTYSTNMPARAAFERALNTWRCVTRVNFTVGSTTTNVGPADDNINSVSFNPALAANVLGSCITRFSAQSLTGVCDLYNTLIYVKELDIQLSPNAATFGWNYGTGPTSGNQIDLETVLTHEIGHGHSCDHINTPALAMYWSVSTNTDKRTLTTNEITCGEFRVSNSTSPFCVSSLGGGKQPMTLITAAPNLGPDVTLYKNCVGETTDLTTLFNTSGLTTSWNTGSPTTAPPGIYQLTATNTYGCADVALANIILEVATWTGTVSNDWNTPGNWNINKVPTAQTHVIINGGTPNPCYVNTPNATAASIQVRSSGNFRVQNNLSVLVNGNCLTLPAN